MKIISMKCPQCQGSLDIKEEQRGKFTTCPFCGTRFLLEEEQPNINQTINIKEVHIGDTRRTTESPRTVKRSPALPGLVAIITIIVVFTMLIPMLFRQFDRIDIGANTNNPLLPASYRTTPESEAVKEFVETVFSKSVAEITSNEYASIKYLKIYRQPTGSISSKTSDTPWMFIYAKEVGEYGRAVKPETIKVKGTEGIVEDDMQVFTGLESLDLSGDSDISPVDKYENVDFRNLENLHYFTGTSSDLLTRLPLFHDIQNIYGLGSNYLGGEEYLTELKKFSKLKTLNIRSISKDFAADLTFLSSFPELEELSLNFDSGSTWDLGGLSSLTKLKSLDINGYDTKFEHLNVLSGMPQLEKIRFNDVKDLKTLDFAKNMPNLKSLDIEYCPVINLNGLKDSISLTSLSLTHCGDLKDVSALATLTSLKNLDIAYIWNFDVNFPKLHKLTALSEVDIESGHLGIIEGMPSVKKLFIFETSQEYSFKPLLGMDSLAELELCDYSWTGKPDMVQCLTKLPKLRTLTFGYGTLAHNGDYTGVFSLPQVTKLRIKPTDTGSGYISLSISKLKDNKVLKDLDIGGAELLNLDKGYNTENFGEYANDFLSHFPKLKKLNVSHSHIEDLNFVGKMPELESLDISNNYITDISKLLKLKKLKTLTCDINQTANLDLLPDSIKITE